MNKHESPFNVFSLDGRLNTFEHAGWPHTNTKKLLLASKKYRATPQVMAQAGFFAKPIDGSTDNACCPFCLKNLDGWLPTDLPWAEHQAHCPTCPLVCLGDAMSRELTFALGGWRHTGSIAPGAMARAGFFYWPRGEDPTEDDTAICVQCGLALDGWEPQDDPTHEHSRRRPKCPLLVTGTIHAPTHADLLLASVSTEPALREWDGPTSNAGALLELKKTPTGSSTLTTTVKSTKSTASEKSKATPRSTVKKPAQATLKRTTSRPSKTQPWPSIDFVPAPSANLAKLPVPTFHTTTTPKRPAGRPPKTPAAVKFSAPSFHAPPTSGTSVKVVRLSSPGQDVGLVTKEVPLAMALPMVTPKTTQRRGRPRKTPLVSSANKIGLNEPAYVAESAQATPLAKRAKKPFTTAPSVDPAVTRATRLASALKDISALQPSKEDLMRPLSAFLQVLLDRRMAAFDEAVNRHTALPI